MTENGLPETIRTSDTRLRRAVLYPTELQADIRYFSIKRHLLQCFCTRLHKVLILHYKSIFTFNTKKHFDFAKSYLFYFAIFFYLLTFLHQPSLIQYLLNANKKSWHTNLYQLSLRGADDGIRTRDLRLTKAVRYLLCHISIYFVVASFQMLKHYNMFLGDCQ